MFGSKKSVVNSDVTNTIIGEGIKLENASLTGQGTVRIDGEYFGNVTITGDVILGESGALTGDMTVSNTLLAGKMNGNIKAQSTIHLASTANLEGNLDTQNLIIDEGAIFNGKCHMGKEPISLQRHRAESSEDLGKTNV